MTTSLSPRFRVFVDDRAKVLLASELATDSWIEVDRPVTMHALGRARVAVVDLLKGRLQARSPEEMQRRLERKTACGEVVNALDPLRARSLKRRLTYSAQMLGAGLVMLYGLMLFVGLPFAVLQSAHRYLPEPLYLLLLALYALALILGLSVIAEARRRSEQIAGGGKRFRTADRWARTLDWFGPTDLLMFPALVIVVALAVFASFTLALSEHSLVSLEACRQSPVSLDTLSSFYLWHFLNLVPLVKINTVLKWDEPLCYTQARVGTLILLFQAFVVVRCISSMTHFWRHRDEFQHGDYVFDPDWSPADDAAAPTHRTAASV